MKKFPVFLLGIVAGIILTFAVDFFVGKSAGYSNSSITGLELFEEPGECMEFSRFEVFQVVKAGCALATAENASGTTVFIIADESQQFYDEQTITLKSDQCAQRAGTFRYSTKSGIEKTVPAVRIVDRVKPPKQNETTATSTKTNKEKVARPTRKTETVAKTKSNNGKTFFDKPGDCVSRKNFEVQTVLESGDAIALEIRETISGYIFTSDLEVLILAQEDSNFYNNQVVKVPQGKCARQIGNYKYQPYKYGDTKVIPIITFK